MYHEDKIEEPEYTFIATQRLGKQVPAVTHKQKLGIAEL
jgi:hypothetical protein